MQKIRNENGITLIALVITMVLLAIIAVISINYAYDGINYSSEKRMLTELEEVQQAVMQKYTELRHLKLDEEQNSYLNIADELSSSHINKYSSILKHIYKSEENIEPSKKYYSLTQEQLADLGIEMRSRVNEKDFTIKNTDREAITYIVNFYYGEVLNVYHTADCKTAHSGKVLHLEGRTIENETTYHLADLNWGDTGIQTETQGLQIVLESEIESNGMVGALYFTIRNSTDTDKSISLIEIEMGDEFSKVETNGGVFYPVKEGNNIILNKNTNNNVTISPRETIKFGIKVHYLDSEIIKDTTITLLNVECD